MAPHLAAGDDALQVQHALRHRRARGLRARITQLVPPSLVLVVLADQLGKSRGRHVPGRMGAVAPAGAACSWRYTFVLVHREARTGCRPCRRRTRTLPGPGARREVPVGHRALGGAHLPRAGNAAAGSRHARPRAAPWARSGPSCSRCCAIRELGAAGRRAFWRCWSPAASRRSSASYAFKSTAFQVAIADALRRHRLPRPARRDDRGAARPHPQGLRGHHAPHGDGGLHPDRLDLLFRRLPGRERRPVARALAHQPAGRRLGLPALREPLRLLPGVLPRLLRDRLHHRAAARAGREDRSSRRSSATTRRSCGSA